MNIAVYEKLVNNNKIRNKFLNYIKNDSNVNKKYPLIILLYEEANKQFQQLIYNKIGDGNTKNNIESKINFFYNNKYKAENFNINLKPNKEKNSFNNLPEFPKLELENLIKKYQNLTIKDNINANKDEELFKKKWRRI